MKKAYFIEQETIEAAMRNFDEAAKKVNEALENGTPDEVRAAIAEMIQRSQAHRALINARYGF